MHHGHQLHKLFVNRQMGPCTFAECCQLLLQLRLNDDIHVPLTMCTALGSPLYDNLKAPCKPQSKGAEIRMGPCPSIPSFAKHLIIAECLKDGYLCLPHIMLLQPSKTSARSSIRSMPIPAQARGGSLQSHR